MGVVILYGSETGTSEGVAWSISRDLHRHHIPVDIVCALDDYDMTGFPALTHAVFVVSTVGQGEPPHNMRGTWKSLMNKNMPQLPLLSMTVFGLGDSSYPIYNAAARRLFQRLLNLGASILHPRGLGDDQHPLGYDGELVPWVQGLCEELLVYYPLDVGQVIVDVNVLQPPSYKVEISSASVASSSCPRHSNSFATCVTENTRITSESHWQDVRHVEFTSSDALPRYVPGDILLVSPENAKEISLEFIHAHIGLSPDTVIRITSTVNETQGVYPTEAITLLDLCTRYLDIQGTPTRYFFQCLASFTEMDIYKERLKEMAAPEGYDDYLRYSYRERRTYGEVLTDFPSCKLPLEYLLTLIPVIKPRQFSISSSPMAHPGVIHITVALVRYTTPLKRVKEGVCSRYLGELVPGRTVALRIKQGSIRLPKDPLLPIICIGPGTGIAPFRSMCSERHSMRISGTTTGPILVVYGNRSRSGDYYYQDEWQSFVDSGTVTTMCTAFSRDQSEKIYVQHRMAEVASEIWDYLSSGNGYFYLAGASGQMPKDVRATLLRIFQVQGGLSESDSERLLKRMTVLGRFLLECW